MEHTHDQPEVKILDLMETLAVDGPEDAMFNWVGLQVSYRPDKTGSVTRPFWWSLSWLEWDRQRREVEADSLQVLYQKAERKHGESQEET